MGVSMAKNLVLAVLVVENQRPLKINVSNERSFGILWRPK